MASVVLEEDFDEDFEPTEEEILEYAEFLGMDTQKEKHLFWIAKEALKAPLPENWKPCQAEDGNIYYFNFATGESRWDHPCDDRYKALYAEEKRKWLLSQAASKASSSTPSSTNTSGEAVAVPEKTSLTKLEPINKVTKLAPLPALGAKLEPLAKPSLLGSSKLSDPVLNRPPPAVLSKTSSNVSNATTDSIEELPRPKTATGRKTEAPSALPTTQPNTNPSGQEKNEYDDDFDISSPELELSEESDEEVRAPEVPKQVAPKQSNQILEDEPEEDEESSELSETESDDGVLGARKGIMTTNKAAAPAPSASRKPPSIKDIMNAGTATEKEKPPVVPAKDDGALKKTGSKESVTSNGASQKSVTFAPNLVVEYPTSNTPLRSDLRKSVEMEKQKEQERLENSLNEIRNQYELKRAALEQEERQKTEQLRLELTAERITVEQQYSEELKKHTQKIRLSYEEKLRAVEEEEKRKHERVLAERLEAIQREFKEINSKETESLLANEREKFRTAEELRAVKKELEDKQRELQSLNAELERQKRSAATSSSTANNSASEDMLKEYTRVQEDLKRKLTSLHEAHLEKESQQRKEYEERLESARSTFAKEYDELASKQEEKLRQLREDFDSEQQRWLRKLETLREEQTLNSAADEHMRQRVANLKTETQALEKELDRLQTSRVEKEQQKESLVSELAKLTADIQVQKAAVLEAKTTLAQLEAEMGSARTRLTALNTLGANHVVKAAEKQQFNQRLAELLKPTQNTQAINLNLEKQASTASLVSVDAALPVVDVETAPKIRPQTQPEKMKAAVKKISEADEHIKKIREDVLKTALESIQTQMQTLFPPTDINFSEPVEVEEVVADSNDEERFCPTKQLQKQLQIEEERIRRAKETLEAQQKTIQERQMALASAEGAFRQDMEEIVSTMQRTPSPTKYSRHLLSKTSLMSDDVDQQSTLLQNIGTSTTSLEILKYSAMEELDAEMSRLVNLVGEKRDTTSLDFVPRGTSSIDATVNARVAPLSIHRSSSPVSARTYTYSAYEPFRPMSTYKQSQIRSIARGYRKPDTVTTDAQLWFRNFRERTAKV